MSTDTDDEDGWEREEHFDAAFRLVGKYMFFWGTIESELSRSVSKLCGMEGLVASIATANITARDKIYMVRTLVALYGARTPDWAKSADKSLTAINDMAGERNTVAHTLFGPERTGGVRFFAIKAKGKFSIPDVVWGEDDFEAKYDAMSDAKDRLREIVNKAHRAKKQMETPPTPVNLFALHAPTAGHNALGRLMTQGPPPPMLHGSPSPNPTEAPETPQPPRPKPKGSGRKKK